MLRGRRNWRDAYQRAGSHVRFFGDARRYAEAILAKRRAGMPLDDPEAAFVF